MYVQFMKSHTATLTSSSKNFTSLIREACVDVTVSVHENMVEMSILFKTSTTAASAGVGVSESVHGVDDKWCRCRSAVGTGGG